MGALGSAGFSLVPSIRGLARRRVLYLIDGARIESDRRTGPNASFVSPEDIERIEVLRSSSSVFYGSDAIGGVIHLMTRKPGFERGIHGRLLTGYATTNGETGVGLSLEGSVKSWAFSLSLQYADADEYRAPDGRRSSSPNTPRVAFSPRSPTARIRGKSTSASSGRRGTGHRQADTTAATKPTWYPGENQNLLQFHWKEKKVGQDGEILFHAFVNPNFMETLTDTYAGFRTLESFAKTDSTEFGLQLSYAKKPGPSSSRAAAITSGGAYRRRFQ